MPPTSSSSSRRPSPRRQPTRAPEVRALLISADPLLRQWFTARLAPRRWRVQAIDSPADLDALQAAPPLALVAYDLALAGSRPADTIAQVRQTIGESVIFLLVRGDEDDPAIDALTDAPADDLLPRPTLAAACEHQARRRLLVAASAAEANSLREELADLRSAAGVQQAFFERLVEHAPEGIVVSGADDRIIRANDRFCRIFGFRHHEVVGRQLDQLIVPETLVEEALGIERRVQAGETVAVECVRCRKDGARVNVSLLATPIRISEDEPGTLTIYRDLSAFRRTEEALHQREQEFRALVEHAPDIISRFDRDFRRLYVSPAIERVLGIPAHEYAGKTIEQSGLDAAAARHWYQGLRAVFASGVEQHFETGWDTPRGRVWLQTRLVPERNADGSIAAVLEISRDVTSQKLAEHALRRSEELYRQLFDHNPQPMWVYDLETLRFLAVNQTAAAKYGYSVDEFLQRTICDIRPPEDVPDLLENLAEPRHEGFERSGLWRHRTRDGRTLWVEVISHGITYQDRPARLVLANDVTQQRAAEQALRKSEQRFRALFDQAPLGVLHFDRDLRIVACNRQLARALGYASARELVGLDLTEIPDSRILPAFRRALRGERAYYEGPYRPIRRGPSPWVALHLSPLYDEVGEVEGGVAVIQDVTAQREASTRLEEQAKELERVNQALQQRSAQVEEALLARNRLYAAMNHELRTPISAIVLYHDLLLGGSMGALSSAQKESLESAQGAAQHLLELVQDVLDLARLEAGSVSVAPEPISVSELLHEMLDTLRPLAERRGSIFDLRGFEPEMTIVTDARRLRQIMLNLLGNALKFGGGRPISVESERLPGGSVAIAVADRGRGIAPEDLERIFDEFVQVGNHQEGGSGLGLAISRRLAELLGGMLTVESEPGTGSTFRLVLPPGGPRPPDGRRGADTAASA